LICQECDYFEGQKAYDYLLGLCTNPLILKVFGKTLVNNTSEQLLCGKRGKKK